MRRNMKKKGALELSVNSIVIMVIAFVVLGLILTFTRTIFKFGTEKTTGIFEATSLDTMPDAANPLTIDGKVNIKKNEEKTMEIGYYNRNAYPAEKAKLGIYSCIDDSDNDVEMQYGAEFLPTITSSSQTVAESDSAGFKIIIKESNLPGGSTYICQVIVYNAKYSSGGKPLTSTINEEELTIRDFTNPIVYESKPIFLKVAA